MTRALAAGALAAASLALTAPAQAQIGPEPPASTIETQARQAESDKQWEKAYTLCLRAASDYVSEQNKAKADETSAMCERIKREWHDATSSPSGGAPAAGGSSSHPLWSAFTPGTGVPSGSYACSTMLMRMVGMSSPGGVGGAPLRVPQMMMLGTLRFTPGHYSSPASAPGTWSGSGASLHLSGKPFDTAKAEVGTNGSGRNTVRFTWPPAAQGASPQIWMCTR